MSISQHPLIVQKVTVVGFKKDYTVPFKAGLNIIYGDSDTGKSTVAHLIDYCLGAKTFDLYDEIEVAAQYCLMEVMLGESVCTIKRDLFNTNSFIEVFFSAIDGMNSIFPQLFGPNYNTPGPNGFYSDFLLEALGLPVVKVKEAPSKAESKMTRLSFRDLMKYMYLDQDDVGSKGLLLHGTAAFAVATKNKECFKYIFNLLDSQITELQAEISEKTQKKNALEGKSASVQSFLRETNFLTSTLIAEKLENLENQEKALADEICKLDSKMISSTALHNNIREVVRETERTLQDNLQRQNVIYASIERFVKLKNEYVRDIQKLKASIQIQERVARPPEEAKCPVCDGIIRCNSEAFHVLTVEDKKEQLSLLSARMRDVTGLIDKERNEKDLLGKEYESLLSQQNTTRRLLDIKTAESITPFVSQRDGLVSQKTSVIEEKKQLLYFSKIRNQQEGIQREISSLAATLKNLQEQLSHLRQGMPSSTDVLGDLGDILNSYLSTVSIKRRSGVGIDPATYLPVLRDRIYHKITSGGLRTILSIGYFVSILQYGLEKESNLPSFFMADTISKYLRKTKDRYKTETNEAEDVQEGLTDPDKIKNMYKILLSLHSESLKNNKPMQIIIVDNDLPVGMEKILRKFVRARYSTTGENGMPIGFIDDADQLLSS